MSVMKSKYNNGLPVPKKRIFTITYEATDANSIKRVLNNIMDSLSSGVISGEGKGPDVTYIFNQEFVKNMDYTIETIDGVPCKIFKSSM